MDNEKSLYKYLKYRSKYQRLVNQMGGAMTEDDFAKIKFHNYNVFFDKGRNNLWMNEEFSGKKEEVKELFRDEYTQLCQEALAVRQEKDRPVWTEEEEYSNLEWFEECVGKTLRDRYYVRISNLSNLLNLNTLQYGDVINMDFLNDFYINLFKGTSFKKYFHEKTKITEDLRKRYNIFLEYKEEENAVPKKRYFTFVDNPNPCHLMKILKDEFKRGEDVDQMPTKYAFVNIKELGRGKAGTASLLGYYHDYDLTKGKLQIAAKLMSSDQFDVTNNGKYLPLRITYLEGRKSSRASFTDRNVRFRYPIGLIDQIEKYYPGYRNHNIFETEHDQFQYVMLSVASDNFSNQTIMHMILEEILEEFQLPNYVKQFDAMLCYGTEDTFNPEEGQSWYEFMMSNLSYAKNLIARQFNLKTAQVDGLNFMEIANAGDLYGHLFDIQKERFMKVRRPSDLEDEKLFKSLQDFLGEMISQLLRPLSILHHSKYAFVHGDLKTKNVFVKKDGKDKYIYKIADYDKSSINYNGVRFHNEGNAMVKFYFQTLGLSGQFSEEEVKKKMEDNESVKDDILDITKEDYIEKLLRKGDDNIKMMTLNGLIIDYIVKNNELPLHLSQILGKYCPNTRKLLAYLDNCYKKRFELEREGEKEVEQLISYYRQLLEKQGEGEIIDLYYNLNSFISKASIFFTSLEAVEFEQLFVRYSPIPFYHTIDLYTLFLSLLQSPMILVYLRYCHLNKEDSDVQDDIFWNSFYDLWASDEDVHTVLGYYEYLFKHPVLDDVATINFILDVIKKNPIALLKRVDDEYWERAWASKRESYNYSSDIADELGASPSPIKRPLKLSMGSFLTYPQICLSDCNNFSLKVHRGSTVFYLNKDLVVYSISTLGEKLAAVSRKKEQLTSDLKNQYKGSLQRQILGYIGEDFGKLSGEKKRLLKLDQRPTLTEHKPQPINPPITKEDLDIFMKGNRDEVDKYIYLCMRDDLLEAVSITDGKPLKMVKGLERLLTESEGRHKFLTGVWPARTEHKLSNINRRYLENLLIERKEYDKLYDMLIQYMIFRTRPEKGFDDKRYSDAVIDMVNKIYKDLKEGLPKKRPTDEEKKEDAEGDAEGEAEGKKDEKLDDDLEDDDAFDIARPAQEGLCLDLREYLREKMRTCIEKQREIMGQKLEAIREGAHTAALEKVRKENEEIDRQNDRARAIAQKGDEEKFQAIVKNLKNSKYQGPLDDYVSHVFIDRRDLINIAQTNVYKDVLGNHLNWDYCPIDKEYIKEILEEVQLF